MTVLVIGEFRFPPENISAARDAMARVISATRAEVGCLSYAFAEDVMEAGLFRISERWESQANLDSHFAMPHMKTWQQDREALGVFDRSVVIVEPASERQL